mmetsp:Transcript_31133/g.91479  ORF Transcript_31133/g.91479 Transcript_31133/m.91479 type:complete len:381 (+) Transcript_31133:1678-2820(+)
MGLLHAADALPQRQPRQLVAALPLRLCHLRVHAHPAQPGHRLPLRARAHLPLAAAHVVLHLRDRRQPRVGLVGRRGVGPRLLLVRGDGRAGPPLQQPDPQRLRRAHAEHAARQPDARRAHQVQARDPAARRREENGGGAAREGQRRRQRRRRAARVPQAARGGGQPVLGGGCRRRKLDRRGARVGGAEQVDVGHGPRRDGRRPRGGAAAAAAARLSHRRALHPPGQAAMHEPHFSHALLAAITAPAPPRRGRCIISPRARSPPGETCVGRRGRDGMRVTGDRRQVAWPNASGSVRRARVSNGPSEQRPSCLGGGRPGPKCSSHRVRRQRGAQHGAVCSGVLVACWRVSMRRGTRCMCGRHESCVGGWPRLRARHSMPEQQ